MAFKTLGVGGDFPRTHNLAEDGPAIGTFVETRLVDTKFGADKPVHTFAGPGGEEFQLWGNFRINEAVELVKDEQPPVVLRITDPGTKTITKSGNSVRDIIIEVGDASDLDDAPVPASVSAPADDDI